MFETNESYGTTVLDILRSEQIAIWSEVEIETNDGLKLKALILPPPKDKTNILFVKLPNGYNIGISPSRIRKIRLIRKREVRYEIPQKEIKQLKKLKTISLMGAGGTIASRVEYETGAVKPAFTPYELINAIPEIFEMANIEPELVFNIFSEDMTPKHWIELAKKAEKKIRNGADAILITHGTDTMQYTASALAFMMQKLSVPIILVGAQRSSDRPASDAATNVIGAVKFAIDSKVAEVVVSMHARSDDTRILIHRGVRVRKMHSSRRDAFRTIADVPLAVVEGNKIKYLRDDYDKIGRFGKDETYVDAVFEEKVALIHTYANMDPDIINILVDKQYRGLILAGTGLGHAPKKILSALERAVSEGMLIFMTTQCLWGPVRLNVYERGRVLQKIGIIPADGLLPETAYVKLGWLLGHDNYDRETIINLMKADLRHEIVKKERPDTFFYNV